MQPSAQKMTADFSAVGDAHEHDTNFTDETLVAGGSFRALCNAQENEHRFQCGQGCSVSTDTKIRRTYA